MRNSRKGTVLSSPRASVRGWKSSRNRSAAMKTPRLELESFSWVGDRFPGTQRTESSVRLLWIRSGSGRITSGQHSAPFRPYTVIGVGAEDVHVHPEDRISGY